MLREHATEIVRRLTDAGHEAVFAGGCVRDRLLAIEPSDYDIATSARPEQIEELFEGTIPVGRSFGVLLVPQDGDHFEVATYRKDGAYVDGRRPTSVTFCDAREDAMRRDFTINAMFEDPVSGEIKDYVGGREDLASGVVRAVGDAEQRFAEDRLRLLRAVRFAARFGFEIDERTYEAISRQAGDIGAVAAERIGAELARILTDGGARRGFELLDGTGLLEVVLPEIVGLKGCEQTPDHHPEGDVFVHTMLCLDNLPKPCTLTLALGTLLHDVAKPATAELRDGRYTFYGHTGLGAEMAAAVCSRLRYSGEIKQQVCFLVDQHLRHCAAVDMKPSTLKRFLRQDGIDELLALARIDALSSSGDLGHYEFCTRALAELPEDEIRPPRLVTGHDLIAMGLEPGPLFKKVLRIVEDAQLEGRVSDRDEALALAAAEARRP